MPTPSGNRQGHLNPANVNPRRKVMKIRVNLRVWFNSKMGAGATEIGYTDWREDSVDEAVRKALTYAINRGFSDADVESVEILEGKLARDADL